MIPAVEQTPSTRCALGKDDAEAKTAVRLLKRLQAVLPWDQSIADLKDPHVLEVANEAAKRIGESASIAAAKLFQDSDENHDGVLSFSELQLLDIDLKFRPGEKALTFVEFLKRFAREKGKATNERPNDEQLRDDAVALLGTYATETRGQLSLLDFKRMLTGLDSTFGWKHSLTDCLTKFKEHDRGDGSVDLEGLTRLLRKLHGLPAVRRGGPKSRLAVLLDDIRTVDGASTLNEDGDARAPPPKAGAARRPRQRSKSFEIPPTTHCPIRRPLTQAASGSSVLGGVAEGGVAGAGGSRVSAGGDDDANGAPVGTPSAAAAASKRPGKAPITSAEKYRELLLKQCAIDRKSVV